MGVTSSAEGIVATASGDRTCRLWDLRPPWGAKTGSQISCMRGHTGMIRDVKLASTGRMAMSVSDDGAVRIWNVLKGSCTRVFTGHMYAITPFLQYIFVTFVHVPRERMRLPAH